MWSNNWSSNLLKKSRPKTIRGGYPPIPEKSDYLVRYVIIYSISEWQEFMEIGLNVNKLLTKNSSLTLTPRRIHFLCIFTCRYRMRPWCNGYYFSVALYMRWHILFYFYFFIYFLLISSISPSILLISPWHSKRRGRQYISM